ncbi:MAG: cysteine--tRNA ligase [Gammaproteobacteria bacterium RIFOXYB2_FULL_38_6]|nr:MAG: cysteine--tRNA ligase [Gammaproteobacteria bacterium RIFOXYB2_FULL_38_6]
MLKIYNSLTKQKEIFKPIRENKIGLYTCGVTVYDDCHIGHARTFIIFDVIVRYLKFLGFDVTFVRNITDVDDKIIKRAYENNESIDQLTQRMIASMHDDLNQLHLLSPTYEPRATEYMSEMIQMIQELQQKGYAYLTELGDVCFEVRKFKNYGQLSHRDVDELQVGVRIEKDSTKKDPLDFVLWKAAKPDEPAWDSSWGKGRPGWHIECSAMSTKLLGQPFDLHGGGLDLKFPHHENEVAQSECAHQKTFANSWMHVGLLQINHQKMSKSLNNFFTIKDVLKLHHPEVIRYLMILSHYRSPLQYSDDNLKNAKASLERLYTSLRDIYLDENKCDEKFKQQFIEAMNDDFNTPQALAVLFELSHEINRNQGNPEKIAVLANTLKTLGGVLGILQENPVIFLQGDESDEKIKSLIKQRADARKNKDFKKADVIRDQLSQMGILIEDGAQGTSWRRI